ncbi:hypothetical protein CVT25_007999 [Psilocybe cyanescens]|uniref:Uncharacterized protein n=1 Tax=Psilocybe cyanescens TaxID=93625 RepID=A0A409VZD5_PSICY|nr:hypothetical protein CVT25_007999 [Psilocybe cyanescens]
MDFVDFIETEQGNLAGAAASVEDLVEELDEAKEMRLHEQRAWEDWQSQVDDVLGQEQRTLLQQFRYQKSRKRYNCTQRIIGLQAEDNRMISWQMLDNG